MHFRRPQREEPEINLIAFIDVLLVILIFLMLTTTYNRFTEMQLRLPVADADAPREHPREIVVAIGADGQYAVNRSLLEGRSVDAVAAALGQAAGSNKDMVLIISADASARHQSVITVMEAARRVGLTQITFATQSPAQAGDR
ncbi:MAG: ExbD/TolR family protein [Hylemonella sp.]